MIKYLEFYEFCINSFGMCKSSRGSVFGGGGGNTADYQWFPGRVSVRLCLHWKIVDYIGCFRFYSSSWICSEVLGLHPKQTQSLSWGGCSDVEQQKSAARYPPGTCVSRNN